MRFGSRGPRKILSCLPAVHLGYVTGMHWPRRPGKTPYRDQASPSTRIRFWLAIAKHWFVLLTPPFLGRPPCIFNPSTSKLSLGHFLDTNSVIYNKLSSLKSHCLIRSFYLSSCGDNNTIECLKHAAQNSICHFRIALSLCFKARLTACEPQTYFRSSPLSFRKITTVFLGGRN